VPLLELAAAALLAQAAAAPPTDPVGAQPPIHVESQEAVWDAGAGEAQLKGGVLVQRGTLVLRAPEARYQPGTGLIEVTGGALLVDGPRAIVARAIRGELGGVYEAEEPSVFFADDPRALAAATSAEEAGRVSRRRLTLRADRATGTAEGSITLTGARGTLCNCPGAAPPTWELRARTADVLAGDRAILSWPSLWVVPPFFSKAVPVLALPWLYVPLGDRQTGFLLPEFGSSGASGPTLAEPFFLTLGRSADLTVWAGWAFGRSSAEVRAGNPSVRGFDGALELRWAPTPTASGRLKLDYLHDLDAEPGGTHGPRVALSGRHVQTLGDRTALHAELDLVGDPLYVRDFTGDLLQRDAPYRRSAFLASHGREDLVVEASGAWLIPLAKDGSLGGVDGLSFGTFGSGLPTFHRGPSLSAQLLPTPIPGGLLASGRAEVARFGPFSGVTSDSGSDGIGPGDRGWVAATPSPGQLDGTFEPGERLAATRALVRAALTLPIPVGRWLRLSASLRGAANAYAFDAAVDPILDAWGVAAATLETELSRGYGALRHVIVPRLAFLAGTTVAGGRLPAFGYDGWDRAGEIPPGVAAPFPGARLLSAAPQGDYRQLRGAVETRLTGPAGEHLRAELGQDFDFRTGAPAESFATLRVQAGPVGLDGLARYAGFATRPVSPSDPSAKLDDWTELAGGLRFANARGYAAGVGVRAIGAGGSPTALGGVDALFDLRPVPLARSSQGNAGLRLPIGSATIGYDILFPARELTGVTQCDGTGTRSVGPLHPTQHAASLVWDAPCHCLRATLRVAMDDCGNVSGFKALFDFSPPLPPSPPR
jgi:LPS-assembly protein